LGILDLVNTQEQETSRSRKTTGVVIGVVTANNDPEHLSRVKIRFPWLSDNNETDWARVSTFMAGIERGGFFLPEVEDEVLVAFEHGDMKRPIVIGALWNREDKPPESNSDGKNNIRKIKSRSGHEIIFDDSDGKEKVEVHTKAGHKILLDDSAGSAKIAIKDKTENNFIEIDSEQNSLKISSLVDLSIKAQNIQIESSAMMNIKSGATMNINGALVKIN
jgi:uncharacterized protein involved in type VI secretion and phage assembly